jgi:hypothetical protein
MQDAQFSKGNPIKRTYHFIFSGDKIDLYNQLFCVRNILEKKGINLLDFLRVIDSLLSTDLWVIQKITTIEQEMFNLITYEEFFADAEDELLKMKLNMYKEKKFKNYFHVSFYVNADAKSIMRTLYKTDFQIETDSFVMFTTI